VKRRGNRRAKGRGVKKYCNFCGEPLVDSAKECKQCGWDRSQDGPPTQDPGDQKARLGVAAGLVVAFAVMSFLIQSTDVNAGDLAARPQPVMRAEISAPAPEPVAEPVTAQALAVGALPPTVAAIPAAVTPSNKLLTIKVADDKGAHIQPRDAVHYDFELPETDQHCKLVGQLHGTGGYDRDLEIFLLTDDEYIFWHANPAAIPHSSWETFRGSETTLSYDLPSGGTYHLVVSNEMSPNNETVQVKAQVKCTR
jgi:hypothetical protein